VDLSKQSLSTLSSLLNYLLIVNCPQEAAVPP